MSLGAAGEKAAAKALKHSGYRIVARNYRCALGEIDLIAVDSETIVFVEVKTRSTDSAADPENNVTYQKQRRLTRAARCYLIEKSAQDRPCRFDVVAVVMPERGKPQIEHFIDAFAPIPK